MTPTREQIIAKARELLGKPWAHQGRSDTGVDCGGALAWVARELGVSMVDVEGYGRLPSSRSLTQACEANYVRIALASIQPADVVMLRFPGAMHPSHLALVTDWNGGLGLLHSLNAPGSSGRVIEHRLGKTWQHKIVSAWRLPFLGAA
jgi:cell wall-associated NlpC family hydrolase